jgi:hypothetical protein
MGDQKSKNSVCISSNQKASDKKKILEENYLSVNNPTTPIKGGGGHYMSHTKSSKYKLNIK